MKQRNFETYFRILSYLVPISGLFALYLTGGVGEIFAFVFLSAAALAWFIEDSGWQISERAGVALIILLVPLFIVDWRFQVFGGIGGGMLAATGLARLILFLAAVKLLQKKSDRDWIFIYIIAFFEILLAAGLTISPMYLVSLIFYLLFSISAIIAFEIRKTSREVQNANLDSAAENEYSGTKHLRKGSLFKFPITSAGLLLFITLFAVPLFFSLPRVGGAGLGSSLAGGSNISGFSDSVRLGEIGRLKLSDETVMRVRLESRSDPDPASIYWRGVALDTFDGRVWSKSRSNRFERIINSRNGFFSIDIARNTTGNIVQTYYLEPIGTPVIFALSRPIAIRGHFGILRQDRDGSVKANGVGFERSSYQVRSDPRLPDAGVLRRDRGSYPFESLRHMQLPGNLDRRIPELASKVIAESGARNNYDKAKAVESFLRNDFGYSLEMKAGGPDPLADFLFNVREGHCEYFSTAMAIILRTQGIAVRVVNGFQRGEFNETAGLYLVKQRDAHSWVEVYFPETNSWVTFDPTPAEGQFSDVAVTSFVGRVSSYLEAIEAVWIQYFVSYDSQEQRSLFQSAQNKFATYKQTGAGWMESIRTRFDAWWQQIRGDQGFQARMTAIGFAVGYVLAAVLGLLLIVWLYRKAKRSTLWAKIGRWIGPSTAGTGVEFYERMQRILESQGLNRSAFQTPLEFASDIGSPTAVWITQKYNVVRFGGKDLSVEESDEIDSWLEELESMPDSNKSDIVADKA